MLNTKHKNDWSDWFQSNIQTEVAKLEEAKARQEELRILQENYQAAVNAGDIESARELLKPARRGRSHGKTPHLPSTTSTSALLSGSGVTLLVLAALVLGAMTLDPLSLALVLLVVTAVAVNAVKRAQRHSLTVTAEALSWLAGFTSAIAVSIYSFLYTESPHVVFAAGAAATALTAGITIRLATPGVKAPWRMLPFASVASLALATWELPLVMRGLILAVATLTIATLARGTPTPRAWNAAGAIAATAAAFMTVFAINSSLVVLVIALIACTLMMRWGEELTATAWRGPLTAGAFIQVVGAVTLLLVAARQIQLLMPMYSIGVAVIALFTALAVIASRVPSRSAVVFGMLPIAALVGAMASSATVFAFLLLTAGLLVTSLVWMGQWPVPSAAIAGAAATALVGLAAFDLGASVSAAAVSSAVAGALIVNAVPFMKRLTRLAALAVILASGVTAVFAVMELTQSRMATSAGVAVIAVGAAALARVPLIRLHAVLVSAIAASVSYWLFLTPGFTLEVGTLPVAALWLALGIVGLQRTPLPSTVLLGPGLLLALGPSTLLVVTMETGLVRPLVLIAVGGIVALIGARRRLVAPLFVGIGTAVVVAFSQLGPWAAALPRWLTMGIVGLVLLSAGARFESLRNQARGARSRLYELR
jgi:hypothetical protein